MYGESGSLYKCASHFVVGEEADELQLANNKTRKRKWVEVLGDVKKGFDHVKSDRPRIL